MLQNKKGFFSWQGNSGSSVFWTNYLVFAIGIIVVIAMFVFKKTLIKWGSNSGKRMFFKNEGYMWRTIGIIGLFFIIGRMIMMFVYGYPLYWETLGFHLCRALITILFLLLAFNRTKYIKYIIYLSTIGFAAGILFNHESSVLINNSYDSKGVYQYNTLITFKNIDATLTTKAGVLLHPSYFERLMLADGFKYYHAGWDNYFIYDTYIVHLSLLLIPMYIYISRKQRLSVVQYHRTQLVYVFITFLFWIINILLSYSPDIHWRSNYWYIGLDKYNDMNSIFGWLSAWPQNVFTYIFIGFMTTNFIHILLIFNDKFVFFEKDKFVIKVKSQNWEKIKKEYSVGFKNITKAIFYKQK